MSKIKKTAYFLSTYLFLFIEVKAEDSNGLIGPPISATNLNDFFLSIVSVCIMIGTIIAGLAIIYGGLMYVTAQGDEEKISKAHKTLTWALVGTAILLGARVILEAIKATVTALG